MFPFFYDPTFILIIPAMALAMYAQYKVQNAYSTYSKYFSRYGRNGGDIARDILNREGLYDVKVECIRGHLSDHYDPRDKVLRLSESVYYGSSLAALGIAAHEAGHAMQHGEGYMLLGLRSSVVPLANIGSYAALPLLFIGLMLGSKALAGVGILVFLFAVLFQLVTLPVEFNASSRAVQALTSGGYIAGDEIEPVKKVLSAAALTYVAATVMAVMQLIRMLLISGILGGRDE